MKALLVGEDNPYGSDPRYALWCEPRRSAGGRLCYEILGLTSQKEYLIHFDRANLCAGKWFTKEARKRAGEIALEIEKKWSAIVLLGQKVSQAFGLPFEPYTCRKGKVYGGEYPCPVVMLPHPSGRNRMWNEPGAILRARTALIVAGVLPVLCRWCAKPHSEERVCWENRSVAIPRRADGTSAIDLDELPSADMTTERPARCENCGKLVTDRYCSDCGSYDDGWRLCRVCGKPFKGVKDADLSSIAERACSPSCVDEYGGVVDAQR